MKDKKHIDRLYQEKFKDFESTPREAVWKNISARLQKKERKRGILPLWYKIAGVAAVLALFINFSNEFFSKKSKINNQAFVALADENFGENSIASSAYKQNMIRSSKVLQALMKDTKNLEANEALKAEKHREKIKMISSKNISHPSNLTIVSKKSAYSFIDHNTAGSQITLIEQEVQPEIQLRDLPIPNSENEEEQAKITEKTIPDKKLSVSTTAAPIYSDNFGSGNTIDDQFANNQGSSEITISYGINFAYQISKKIRIRSGISKVDLSYNTKNIAFTAAVNPSALSGIDYNGNIPNYRIENRSVRPFSNISASTEFNRASLASPTSGYLNQKLGFIEVPLEIEYVIIDKQIGLNIIGGGSTLFLDENMISLKASDFSTNLGEGNNLNKVSFSTNIGIGLDYDISPEFQLNLEPIFKYQINTFNNGTGDVKPYYFGVYSGFSFKF
jgi:hypothetical protein